MRSFTLIFALLLMGVVSYAQDTIRVVPDGTKIGALNDAIALHGANKVYLLEVNGFYTLSSTIEFLRPATDPTAWYQIVAKKPTKAGDYMAVVQVGTNAENKPFGEMFIIKANVTFKNIFMANQTATGELGNMVFHCTDKANLTIDGCMIDPVGWTAFIVGNELSLGSNLRLTNSTVLRHGDKYGPNGGHLIWNLMADSMYIENNSFVSTDQNLISGDYKADNQIKFLWFNHNTVVYHDVCLLPSKFMPATYMTNNLFYDATLFVVVQKWAPFQEKYGSYPTFALADTAIIAGIKETLPSTRTDFWNRNALYVSKAVQDTLLGHSVKDPTDTQIWQYPVLWNDKVPHYFVTDWSVRGQDILDKSREAKMFKSPSFPKFKEDNTYYDMNPNFVDSRVESFSKVVAGSVHYWYKLNGLLKGTNTAAPQKSMFWDVDEWAGTSAAMYPAVWPRWNGAYTNETLLKSSTEGLPLGDLNAFPVAKAKWEAMKKGAMQHILSLNTGIYIPTGVKDLSIADGLNVYPNPANGIVTFESKSMLNSLKIYNIAGQLIKTKEINGYKVSLDLSALVKGVYVIKAQYKEGGSVSSKLIKE